MIVIFTGSKLWEEKTVVWNMLDDTYQCALREQENMPDKYRAHFPFDVGIELFNGECDTGADLFAKQWYEYAIKEGYQVTYRPFPAQWRLCSDMCPPDFVQKKQHFKHRRYGQFGEYCPTAGMKRNRDMIQAAELEAHKHYVPGVCLAFCLNDSPGTINCARLAKRKGFQTHPYRMGVSTKRI